MKRNILTLVLLISLSLQAQSIDLRFGLNHSYQLQKYENNEIHTDKVFNLGYLAGANFNFDLKNDWYLSPGLYFKTKGDGEHITPVPYPVTGSEPSETHSFNLYDKIFYLDIPILIKKNFMLNDKLAIYAGLGPYLGIKLGSCTKADNKKCDDGRRINSIIKPIDFGLSTEAGLVIQQKYIISFSYDYGFYNIHDLKISPLDTSSSDYTTKNRVFSFGLGYRFDL